MKFLLIRLPSTLFLLSYLVISGCSAVNEQSASNINSTEIFSSETRVIEHAMGTTKIEGTPQRIIVLTNEATDMVLELGIKPVGAVKSWSGDPYFDYIEEEMTEVPVVGDEFQPNLEKIVALKPDLIIGSKIRQQQVYDQLSAITPTVFSETIGVSWQDNLRLYAQALNKEAEANAILARWHQRVADFKAKLPKPSPTVSLVRFAPGMARIYYQDSFPGQIISEVGLRRPPSQTKDKFAKEVGLENIPQMDGDILFYFTYEQGEKKGDKLAQKWLNHPLWQQLKVVENDQIYQVNDVYWTTAGGVQSANKVLDDLYKYVLKE